MEHAKTSVRNGHLLDPEQRIRTFLSPEEIARMRDAATSMENTRLSGIALYNEVMHRVYGAGSDGAAKQSDSNLPTLAQFMYWVRRHDI